MAFWVRVSSRADGSPVPVDAVLDEPGAVGRRLASSGVSAYFAAAASRSMYTRCWTRSLRQKSSGRVMLNEKRMSSGWTKSIGKPIHFATSGTMVGSMGPVPASSAAACSSRGSRTGSMMGMPIMSAAGAPVIGSIAGTGMSGEAAISSRIMAAA